MTSTKQFYVYLIRDPRMGKNNVPIYVGKGRGNRGRIHLSNKQHSNVMMRGFLIKCKKLDLKPRLEIVSYFEDEQSAFNLEIALIEQYGRRDLRTGTLYNLTNGGEGTSGCLVTAENMRRLNADPEFKKAASKRMSKIVQKLNADPEFTKAKGDRFRALHADPEFAKAHAERASTRIRARNVDPDFQRICTEGLRTARANPDVAKGYAERMSALHKRPEFAKARDEHLRKLHADPEVQARRLAGIRAYHNRRNTAKDVL